MKFNVNFSAFQDQQISASVGNCKAVNFYLTGHIHGLRYWVKRMGSCHDSDKCVDT